MTHIEWTDETWNPMVGCSKVSAGCKNCYAINMAHRLQAMGVPQYQGLTTTQHGRPNWTGKSSGLVSKNNGYSNELWKPKGWKKPRMVFVCSMSDLFFEQHSFSQIWAVMFLIKETPHHTYQILTKRPERLLEYGVPTSYNGYRRGIPNNAWVGVSVEDAEQLHRIDTLRYFDSAEDNAGFPNKKRIRFVSFEPLIGSVGDIDLTGIDWAIVGGESGHGARPMKPEWVDEIFAACQRSGTAFFFKQWGAYGEDGVKRSKKANGRLYKGREWKDRP